MGNWRSEAAQARFVILGATGWIGRASLAWLFEVVGPGWRSKTECFGSSARTVVAPDGGEIQIRDLKTLRGADLDSAIVLHLSYLTKDKVGGMSDAAFVAANLGIDETVLAALRNSNPGGVFVASSGAARDVSTGSSRDPYGETKLLQEERFAKYAKDSARPVLVGRVFNIAGPHINKMGSYAISSFAVQGIKTGRIRIEARTPVFRSFLHVNDLIDIVVAELIAGQPTVAATDLCGPEVLEMGDIALAVARELGLPPSAIDRGSVDKSVSSSYVGDPLPALAIAKRHGLALKSFDVQVRDTVAFVRCELNT